MVLWEVVLAVEENTEKVLTNRQPRPSIFFSNR
jgi:hypothetical protein